MTFKMKNMTYWKAKNGLPGINNDFEKGNNLPDGRSKSSPFQIDPKKNRKDGVPRKNTKGAPIETEKSTAKRDFKSSEAVANIGDQIDFLTEDYETHGTISKSQYEAKLKILRMKEDAAIKAHKAR